MKKRGLGKGLNALLAINITNDNEYEINNLNIEQIIPNKYQPRQKFSQDSLQELATSIKTQGLLQPILVRYIVDGKYELIAGERRWQACKLAGLTTISAIVRNVNDSDAAVLALIENLQRENLNALEQAYALDKLQQEFNLTQQQIADVIGKSRTTITNSLRLLNLHDDVKNMLLNNELDMGHARALLGLDISEQFTIAQMVCNKGLNVRQTEQLVRELQQKSTNNQQATEFTNNNYHDLNIVKLQNELTNKINFKVQIKCNAQGKGKLVINYDSVDNLNKLLNIFK